MSEEKTNDWQAREIGALWKRDGQNQKYLSGKMKLPDNLGGGEFGVVVFTNRHKKQDNHPDFRLYLDSKSVVVGEESQAEPVGQATEEIL